MCVPGCVLLKTLTSAKPELPAGTLTESFCPPAPPQRAGQTIPRAMRRSDHPQSNASKLYTSEPSVHQKAHRWDGSRTFLFCPLPLDPQGSSGYMECDPSVQIGPPPLVHHPPVGPVSRTLSLWICFIIFFGTVLGYWAHRLPPNGTGTLVDHQPSMYFWVSPALQTAFPAGGI
jgi:hypothetical protein